MEPSAAKIGANTKKHEPSSEEYIGSSIETALKSALYMHIRDIYNMRRGDDYHPSRALRAAIFFFIRNYSFQGMFRHNSRGDFNVPYGGESYNRRG